jgi:hypothetical protein
VSSVPGVTACDVFTNIPTGLIRGVINLAGAGPDAVSTTGVLNLDYVAVVGQLLSGPDVDAYRAAMLRYQVSHTTATSIPTLTRIAGVVVR